NVLRLRQGGLRRYPEGKSLRANGEMRRSPSIRATSPPQQSRTIELGTQIAQYDATQASGSLSSNLYYLRN
ncbi:hypothetical protein LTR16_005977, partial [Cryomyces antarcticus]